MPTYEFRCPDGHTFERFFRTISGAEAEVPCPECGKTATRQMSAGAGLLFKGSGFYLTDYGKNAHRGEAPKTEGASESKGDKPAAESKPSSESGSKSESKSSESKSSESKPASSSTAAPATPKPPKS